MAVPTLRFPAMLEVFPGAILPAAEGRAAPCRQSNSASRVGRS